MINNKTALSILVYYYKKCIPFTNCTEARKTIQVDVRRHLNPVTSALSAVDNINPSHQFCFSFKITHCIGLLLQKCADSKLC